MQPPKVREVIRRLQSEGWRLDRQNGDHRQFKKGGKLVTVSGKLSDHVKRGTWGKIKDQAGW